MDTDLNCFSQININEESIEYKIKKYRKDIKSEYEHNKLFSEIIPVIKKQSEKKNIYEALIKNGLKYNSSLIRLICKTINKIERKNLRKSFEENKKEKNNTYHLPKIEMLKTEKEKYNDNNIIKLRKIKLKKERLEKNKSKIKKEINTLPLKTINKSPKIKKNRLLFFPKFTSSQSTKNINSYNKNKSNISFNKNITLDNTTSSNKELSTNISNYYSRYVNKYKTYINPIFYSDNKKNSLFILNQSKSLDILQKCEQEVKKVNRASVDISQYKKDCDILIKQKINSMDLLDLDHKVIEEKNKLRNKFTLMEEKNFEKMKKELEEKVSDNFAYRNRKELTELLKVDKNASAYNLHLKEVGKINKKLIKRIDLERKKINKIKLMVNDEFCRSIAINKKMNEINEKNKRIHKSTISDKVISPEKFLTPIVKNYGLKGNLVPTIINIRKKGIKHIGIKKNNNNYLYKI